MLLPAFTGSGASLRESVRTGRAETVVVVAAPFTAVISLESMLKAPLVIVVPLARGVLTRATSCTDAEAPALRARMDQVTTPADCVPPPVAETNVVLAGSVSAITTPEAFMLPVFE